MDNTPQKLTQEQLRYHPTDQDIWEAIHTLQHYLHEDIAEYERQTPEEQVGHIGQALTVLKSFQEAARPNRANPLGAVLPPFRWAIWVTLFTALMYSPTSPNCQENSET